jgi:hypothetical protein
MLGADQLANELASAIPEIVKNVLNKIKSK